MLLVIKKQGNDRLFVFVKSRPVQCGHFGDLVHHINIGFHFNALLDDLFSSTAGQT